MKVSAVRFLRRHSRTVADIPDLMSAFERPLQELFKSVGIFVLAQSVPEIFELYRDQFLPRHGRPVGVTADLIGADERSCKGGSGTL